MQNKGAEKVANGVVFNKSVRQTDQGSFNVPHNVASETRARRTVTKLRKESIGSKLRTSKVKDISQFRSFCFVDGTCSGLERERLNGKEVTNTKRKTVFEIYVS